MPFFFQLFKCSGGWNNYWGYFDANGSSANIWCITAGRKALEKAKGKSPIMIFSKAAHYSIDTAGFQTGLDRKVVNEREDGSVDMEELRKAFNDNADRPILMVIVCGGTVKNGRDNIRDVLEVVDATGRPREDFFVHVDAALRGVPDGLMGDPRDAGKIPDFSVVVGRGFNIDSLMTSPHKHIGTLEPAGVIVMKRAHSDALGKDIEYIQSRSNTQHCSRNARPIIECWLLLKYLGSDVLRDWGFACAARALRMKKELEEAGAEDVRLDEHSNIIHCKEFCPEVSKRFHLAPKSGCVHIVVAPHTLHPDELGLNQDGEPFEAFDTATRFMDAAREALRGKGLSLVH